MSTKPTLHWTRHEYYVKNDFSLYCGLNGHSVKMFLTNMKGKCDVYLSKDGHDVLKELPVDEIPEFLIDNARGHSAVMALSPKMAISVAKLMEIKWKELGHDVKVHVYQPVLCHY